MAQQQWTVPGMGGQTYQVGLYHGTQSGHLLLHCNGKVLLVEFRVLADNSFSFFLGDELYELNIERTGDDFIYTLAHNTDIDSPYNRRQAETQKTDRWLKIGLGVLGVLFLVFLVYFFSFKAERNANHWEELQAGGGITTTVHLSEKGGQWYASYRADDQRYRRALPYYDTLSTLGFPQQAGDQLPARYAEADPETLLIEWAAPEAQQLARYRQLTLERHAEQHPELAPRQVRCQVALAERLEGAEGLAKLYQQANVGFPSYNQNSYLRMVRGKAFRDGAGECL